MRKLLVFLIALVVVGVAVLVVQQQGSEQRLQDEYNAARASADRQDWQSAVTGFEAVVHSRNDYRDAAARLVGAQRELHLSQAYGVALASYRAGHWPDAVTQLGGLATESPGYKDVDARLADARRQLGFEQRHQQATDDLKANDFASAITELEALSSSDYSGADQA